MKQRFLFFLIAVFAMSTVAWADINGTCGENVTYHYDESTHTLTISGTGEMMDCYKAIPWTAYRDSIKNVVIEEGVTKIGEFAFYGCTEMSDVTIPASVEIIGRYAFEGCIGLEYLSFADDTHLTTIGDGAFAGCHNLKQKSLTIPGSVTSIGESAFDGCSSLETITLSNSTSDDEITIGNDAFRTGELTTLNIYRKFSGNLFKRNESLKTVNINCNITSIANNAFEGCSGLTTITMPASVTSIGSEAFKNCTSLKTITMPASVTSIGSRAFYLCTNLKTITMPDGVKSIGSYAFSECSALTTITIPASVKSIDRNAFWGCTSMESVTIADGSQLETIGDLAFYYTNLESVTIPSNVKTIGDLAFADCANLTTFTIGNDVATNAIITIGEDVVKNCPKLETVNVATNIAGIGLASNANIKTINISSNVTNLCDSVFYGCEGLETVNFAADSHLTTIGKNAFYGCKKLTTFTIPASVTSIGGSAFANCTGLTSIDIPSSVTSLCDSVFYCCEGIETVNFAADSHLTTIGKYAFCGCDNLTTITIPASLTSLGIGTFSYCPKLENITVAEGNTSFACEDSVLFDYTKTRLIKYPQGRSATTYDIPASVVTIGDEAFSCCEGLTSITIPASVKTIGHSAFSDCYGLTSITIPASIKTIGDEAFAWCDGANTVTIGSGVTNIGKSAFSGCFEVTDVYCYADPSVLTWNADAEEYDFNDDNATVCHVADANAWSEFDQVNVTFKSGLPATSTYYNTLAHMKVDDNTTVYKAAIDGCSVVLTEVADKVITAGQAVVLKSSSADAIALTPQASASTDDYTDNKLQGVDMATEQEDGYSYYVLSMKSNTFGFYKLVSNKKLGANKAFLKAGADAAREFLGIEEETTKIATTVFTDNTDTPAIYDLQGRKVSKPTKGMYIVNGRKVAIK